MYLSLLPASLLISLAAAQTTTESVLSASSAAAGTVSVCAAQPVLESCLATTEATASGCASTDYQCLCQSWSTVLVCFNNCPNDSRYSSVLSQQETYCNDMSAYDTTTTTPVSRAVSSSGSVATTTGAGSNAQTTGSNTVVQTASGTSTSTSASASSSATGKSGAGSNMMIGAGQVVLGLAGVVGVLL